LVSRIAPHDQLLEEANGLALRIAANPREAVRATKRLLRRAWGTRLETALDLSAAMQAIMHSTDEHRQALAAAAQKLGATSR
ncbi:hypothetical protein, partial [Proteus mirabilis]|uniref:hypothetical protein n=1 Tax=Proteus mirabilis TaxID=584 RepID=UPI003F67FAED